MKHLERAVELKPEDPTINDHLGDAYWRVGRTLEAQFQWAHARDLKPEPDELREDRGEAQDRPAGRSRFRRREPPTQAARSPATAAELGHRADMADSAASPERAPAKVNLTLRVLGRRADGYHELESLVVFADRRRPSGASCRATRCRSRCAARPPRPAGALATISCSRPRGARRARSRPAGWAVSRLTKRLPVAAGLGGGSADAAAALRLLARANDLAARRSARARCAARATGADVPVCLDPRPRIMRGIGDDLCPTARACRRCRPCWSIRASRCRPGMCSRRFAAPAA